MDQTGAEMPDLEMTLQFALPPEEGGGGGGGDNMCFRAKIMLIAQTPLCRNIHRFILSYRVDYV
jgi:hypothetical protein